MNDQAIDAMQRPDLAMRTWHALLEHNPGPGFYWVLRPSWMQPYLLWNNVFAGQWEDFTNGERFDHDDADAWARRD